MIPSAAAFAMMSADAGVTTRRTPGAIVFPSR
jgi:hypothetical protein